MENSNKKNIEAIYPLSPMQQGMLFHTLYHPETSEYFEQLTCTLTGTLNLSAFKKAWQYIVGRHPILRTSFVWKKTSKMLQVVHREVNIPIEMLDWRDLPESAVEMDFHDFLKNDREKGFNLSKAPLIRLTLIQIQEDKYKFVWSNHHILLDGWSLPILWEELFSFYEAYRQNHSIDVSPGRPFRDYINYLQKQDRFKAEQFWREYLQGFTAPTSLGIDTLPKDDTEKKYVKLTEKLDRETSFKLQNLVKKYKITLNSLMQGIWAVLLHRYSGENDVVFGATFAGRPPELTGSETMVGLFINTLPVRVQIKPDQSVIDLLQNIHAQQIELREFESTPLVDIQGWSKIGRNLPLFKSILVFENYPVDSSLQKKKLSFKISEIEAFEKTNYPLTIVSGPGEKIALDVAFDTEIFSRESIRRLLQHLKYFLSQITISPDLPVRSLSVLTDPEKKTILSDWNRTTAQYPADICVHEWFEQTVVRYPQKIALRFEGTELNYQELNKKANQLAWYLKRSGIGPEDVVGICLDRSVEMIVCVLAVLKAGGVYVPLDPAYPDDRLQYMTSNAALTVLLTSENLQKKFSTTEIKKIVVDAEADKIGKEKTKNLPHINLPDNLAYIIYTSGSTGRPKGTMLQHRGLCNFIAAQMKDFLIDENSTILQFASFSFDASVAEIFPALISGATLQMATRTNILSLPDLEKLIEEKEISIILFPPSLLAILSDKKYAKLRTVASVGESCPVNVARRWSQDYRFINGYGPTENTIGAAWWTVNREIKTNTVPIGFPINNVQVFILASDMSPVPVGVVGELHLSGAGVARGYLHCPDLTAEKFVPDPFNAAAGSRLYKTGDLARYLPDGNIEFIGRADHQVKIRGLRIELGEIESVLNDFEQIRNAAVVVQDDSSQQKRLVAYFEHKPAAQFDTDKMKEFVKSRLPAYMTPSAFVALDQLPKTPGGKIDRRALSQLELKEDQHGDQFVAPRTLTEELLASIWESTLKTEKVGVFDNFFDLGGHSLLATQVVSRIRDAFQVELPIEQVFETEDLAQLAEKIDNFRTENVAVKIPPMKSVKRSAPLPLSFAQQRLWFLDQLEPGNHSYNIPAAFRLTGVLNIAALKMALNAIVIRHEVMRTTFREVAGKVVQVIAPSLDINPSLIDLKNIEPEYSGTWVQALITDEAKKPFDLQEGPLLRMHIFRINESEHIILLNMHHIISDGWSMSVFVRELILLYESFNDGKQPELEKLTFQYADFAHWQRQWLQGEALAGQVDYWKKQLEGIPPVLELPTDFPRPAMQTFNGDNETIHFNKEISQKIKELSRKLKATPYMILLAAFKVLLFRYSGQDDIVVGTPIANRRNSENEKLIGFFVNTLAIRTKLSGNPRFSALVQQIRQTLLGAYAHQDLPFEKLVEEIRPVRDLSHSPVFQVAFILQNLPFEEIAVSNLIFSPIPLNSAIAKYDLSFYLGEDDNGFAGSLEYNTDIFRRSTIRRMLKHFSTILEKVVSDVTQDIATIPIMDELESEKILMQWNQTETNYPMEKTVPGWFGLVAQLQPYAPAVICATGVSENGDYEELSYLELNEKANLLARYLRKLGVRSEAPVGICMERSTEMMVGIMGILKAGGAFVPLDPTYPVDRLAYMIHDSQISVLLTQKKMIPNVPENGAKTVCVDSEWEKIAEENCNEVPLEIIPDNLAYLIYTSGSTGKPKGTMLTHRGLCNLATEHINSFAVGNGKRILQFSSLSFDAAVWETVMALLSGASLYLTSKEVVSSGPELAAFMKKYKITTVTLPPSVLSLLPDDELPNLEILITAGEKTTRDLVEKWSKNRKYFNAYGPTETTVCASLHLCNENYPQNPPIGRPISNFQLYVLDSYLQPVPIGVPGELYIGGVGLARGYLNKPKMSAEKFIPNPFSKNPGERLYQTGDRARYFPDGNVEFLGRSDNQVKVRGFRIELGEIEVVLEKHPDIQDVVVLARDDVAEDRRLVAYWVAKNGRDLNTGEIRNYLRKNLPEYMIPSFYLKLESFPLTPSSKIDRKALHRPDLVRPDDLHEYVAPRNEIEEKLVKIGAELLGIEKIGIYDSFFDLGGHSLLATQFISRIKHTFRIELPLRQIFETPSVAEMANVIRDHLQEGKFHSEEKIEKISRGDQSVEELLAQIDHLSDEEVRTLLDSELNRKK